VLRLELVDPKELFWTPCFLSRECKVPDARAISAARSFAITSVCGPLDPFPILGVTFLSEFTFLGALQAHR
jgi:hypothetical protein